MAGGCWGDFSAEVWAATSDAAFVGELLTQYATRDAVTGEIWTHSVVRVDEALKGQLPSMLEVRQPGGTVGSVAQYDSSFQDLTGLVGELAVFMVKERGGELELAQGLGALPTASVSVTSELRAALAMAHPGGRDLRAFGVDYRFTKDVTDNGLLGGSIDPSRFTVQDRGLPIGVVVDARVLPPGISVQQAMGALGNALAAWEAVTSIRFQILGTEEFAVPPNQLNRSDQRIYVQMGDPYGAIDNEDSTLGRGGRSTTGIFTVSTNPPENLQGLGGTVNGVGFDRSEYGYVILDHEKEALQVLSDFEEVLTHEIGHALGLAHSSEDPNESNETLKAAMMYYRVEGSGRGARLEAYDAEKVQQAYPVGNTPPFGLDRDLLQLAAPVDFLLPGVNEVQLTAGDLQGDPLTVSILEVRENTAAFPSSATTRCDLRRLETTVTAMLRRVSFSILPASSFLTARTFLRLSRSASPGFVMMRMATECRSPG
jgi:hypothetical protein